MPQGYCVAHTAGQSANRPWRPGSAIPPRRMISDWVSWALYPHRPLPLVELLQSSLPAGLSKVSKVRWLDLSKLSIGWAVLARVTRFAWLEAPRGSQGGACQHCPTSDCAPRRRRYRGSVRVACVFLQVQNWILARTTPRGRVVSVGQFDRIEQEPVAPNPNNRAVLTDCRLHC